MKSITVNTRQIKEWQRDLKRLNERGIAYATKNTVNGLAFESRKQWQKTISDKLVNRNKFTKNSVRVTTAKGLIIRRQKAEVGSIAPWMKRVEEGGSESSKNGNVSIPLDRARVGKAHGRMVSAPNRADKIKLKKRAKGGTSKRRNVINLAVARKAKARFVFLEYKKKRGIFKVKHLKGRQETEMVQNLSHDTVHIKPHPTMQPAIKVAMKRKPRIYAKHLLMQLRLGKRWRR